MSDHVNSNGQMFLDLFGSLSSHDEEHDFQVSHEHVELMQLIKAKD